MYTIEAMARRAKNQRKYWSFWGRKRLYTMMVRRNKSLNREGMWYSSEKRGNTMYEISKIR